VVRRGLGELKKKSEVGFGLGGGGGVVRGEGDEGVKRYRDNLSRVYEKKKKPVISEKEFLEYVEANRPRAIG
jgi:hypothetical protein